MVQTPMMTVKSMSTYVTTFVTFRNEVSITYNVGDPGSIPESERSPGEGNGNPLSTLAWKIPWMEKLGRLESMGLQRVRHD